MPVSPGESEHRKFMRSFERDWYRCERNAYLRLQARGLCDKGAVPRFRGFIDVLDVQEWHPHLRGFRHNEIAPSAIFLEYVPDIQPISLELCTPRRLQQLVKAIDALHKAGILHDDIAPRNMMVTPGNEERVMWIDFDRAQTWDTAAMTEMQRQALWSEACLVQDFTSRVVSVSDLDAG